MHCASSSLCSILFLPGPHRGLDWFLSSPENPDPKETTCSPHRPGVYEARFREVDLSLKEAAVPVLLSSKKEKRSRSYERSRATLSLFFFFKYLLLKALMRTVSAVNQNGLGKNILSVLPFIYLTTREESSPRCHLWPFRSQDTV